MEDFALVGGYIGKEKFTAVGAYIYAGGFTVGMRESFEIKAHFENGNFGVATVNENMPEIPVYSDPDNWPVSHFKGCDVCYGNPPCAAWSMAGKKEETQVEEVQDHILLSNLMIGLDPKIWVWESVTQAYLGRFPEFSQYITETAMDRGYSVYHFLHDVKFMGLPQQRRRVFTIASKVKIVFPPPTLPIITVGEALQDIQDPGEIPSMSERVLKYTKMLDEGQRIRQLFIEHEGTPAPSFLIHRADSKKPSQTQLGGAHVIHPTEDRYLGHKEVAALCGYPADYNFVKNAGGYLPQIAKAVTAPAGRYLGKALKKALLVNEKTEVGEWEVNFMGRTGRVDNYEPKNEIKRLQ